MGIKKIIFVGLISLFCSVNLFSVTYNFEKNAKNELETIEKEYLQSGNDDKKKKLLIIDRRYVFREHYIKFRSNEAFELYKKSTENWYAFRNKEADFSIYLKYKYEVEFDTIFDNESSFFRKEDNNRIVELSKLLDNLYNKNSLSLNTIRKTKKEYELSNSKMKEKYDKLFNLVKSDIYDSSLSEFPKPCMLGYVESNGLPDSQKQWLKFRENEAQMYFILSNKDESVYYGKLFEITKRRMDYLENIIENIKKSEKYKDEIPSTKGVLFN